MLLHIWVCYCFVQCLYDTVKVNREMTNFIDCKMVFKAVVCVMVE